MDLEKCGGWWRLPWCERLTAARVAATARNQKLPLSSTERRCCGCTLAESESRRPRVVAARQTDATRRCMGLGGGVGWGGALHVYHGDPPAHHHDSKVYCGEGRGDREGTKGCHRELRQERERGRLLCFYFSSFSLVLQRFPRA